MKTDYIVLNKNKIEERIKELEDWFKKQNDNDLEGLTLFTYFENSKTRETLQELLKESIEAEELFNAARQCSEEYNGNGEYNILSYCGDEPVAKYTNWEEYTKTLNIWH
jgi:hypothetical protein